jgi:hypothetical protein
MWHARVWWQVLASCTDEQLAATWNEAAAVARLKFDWRDQSEPLAAAQAAAYALHYYAPDKVSCRKHGQRVLGRVECGLCQLAVWTGGCSLPGVPDGRICMPW